MGHGPAAGIGDGEAEPTPGVFWGCLLWGPHGWCSLETSVAVPGCWEVGALWAEGLGVLTHRWVCLQTPRAQPVRFTPW